MSLEKPPPFGDDPIGDAGMGRQSLLLKWVLEGAFLPPFDGFNNAVPNDAAKRATVFDRMRLRQDLFAFEGFEWGIYQQWAVMREAAAFRMRPEGGAAAAARDRCRQVFGNYLDAHDDKIMKKLGKACIRAALGRMMTDDEARATVLAISPGGFELSPARRSFEHVIVEAAGAHLDLFEGFTETDLKRFLGAKLGDTMTFCEIRDAEGGVDAYTARCFAFLTAVQEATTDAYTAGIGQLADGGRAPELALRHENAIAIDRGFTGLGGDRFAGRAEMSGVAGTYQHRYSFVVSLTRNTSEEVGPLAVTLERSPEDTVTCLVPPFKVDEKVITVKHNDPDTIPVLSILRDADDFSVTSHKMSLDVPAAANGIPENDTARLEAELLDLPVELNEELVPQPGTRWVFRGLTLDDAAQWQAIEAQQLQMGEFWSPSRLAGIADSVRRSEMLAEMQARIGNGQGFEDYSNADLAAMTEEQLLAVNHLGQPPSSLGISTAEHIDTAIQFTELGTAFDDVKTTKYSVLVAMEVPVGEGVEYAHTSVTTSSGAPVPRKLNPTEGDEVVFFGTVPYVRLLAWNICPLKTPALNGDQATRLRPYEVLEFLGDFRP